MDLNLRADYAGTEYDDFKKLSVNIKGCDLGEVIGHIEIKDLIDHFGFEDVLDEIGYEKVKEYFGFSDEMVLEFPTS